MTEQGGFDTVLMESHDGVALITMNRPESLNALNAKLQQELAQALMRADADDTVRCIILTGAGRAFTAGVDLKHARESLDMDEPASGERPVRVFEAIEKVRKPIIGAINGFAVTGGFEIALGCDILIASRNAKFADTHALVGVIPGAGLSQKLSRIVGLPRAMAMSLTGEYIDAETAYQFGLVSHLVDEAELLPTAMRLAAMIGEADNEIVCGIKMLIRDGADAAMGDAKAMERAAHQAWKDNNSADDAQARRAKVMQRGRSQV